MEKERLVALYNKQARQYEKRRRKRTFDWKWRQKLLHGAGGRILEVAVGAGANFQFYPRSAEVTAVDLSPAMLEKAKAAAAEYGIQADFLASGVEDLTFPKGSFDTIVSTLGLCAYPEPVAVLNRFNRWCKGGGRVLLLEHGISSLRALAWLQNKVDPWQLRAIGCHANRDILHIVSASALDTVRCESHFLDVVHLIWAKPNHTTLG